MGTAQSLSFLRGSWGPSENPGLGERRGSGHRPQTGHEASLTAGDASELPFCSCDRLPGRCGKRWGHRPRQLVQARRSRGRKQSQEAAQSPGGGSRGPPPGRCPRAVGAPAGPLGAQALSLPARGGRWAYSQSWGEGGGLPAPGAQPASVAPGHQLRAAPPSEVRPPGPARIQETTPRAPSGPTALSRLDTALGVLRPGLGRAGGRETRQAPGDLLNE